MWTPQLKMSVAQEKAIHRGRSRDNQLAYIKGFNVTKIQCH